MSKEHGKYPSAWVAGRPAELFCDYIINFFCDGFMMFEEKSVEFAQKAFKTL
jgi:hypothetical protein